MAVQWLTEEEDLVLTAAYLQLQIRKKTTQEEEEVCLDERLAAQSALRSGKHRRRTQPQHIRSLSSVFRGKPWPVSDHRPHRDMMRICCSCIPTSMVIHSFLWSLAVDYGRNEIFEHVENRVPRKNQDSGSVTVDPGTSRSCLWTRDGYPTDNPGLKSWLLASKPWKWELSFNHGFKLPKYNFKWWHI